MLYTTVEISREDKENGINIYIYIYCSYSIVHMTFTYFHGDMTLHAKL